MTSRSDCPCCGSEKAVTVLDEREAVPTLQNTTLATRELALKYVTAALKMVQCEECGFVWNDAYDPAAIVYDETYNNDVSASAYYLNHLDKMADWVLSAIPDEEPIHYVEVGCGSGDFIILLLEKGGDRIKSAVGFDPSHTGNTKLPDDVVIHSRFFGADEIELLSAETNIICSRHTIEHIHNPRPFVEALSAPVKDGSIKLLLETPDVNWILEHGAFQDFFYEHCSIFTPTSMTAILNSVGMVANVSNVYDGQYMWIEASRVPVSRTLSNLQDHRKLAENYVSRLKDYLSKWNQTLDQLNATGPVALWGGASKGVTFALLMKNEFDFPFECAIDLNPDKQGRFLPTTGLEVVDPQSAKERGVTSIVIMNHNYETEIRQMINGMDWSPEVLVLID